MQIFASEHEDEEQALHKPAIVNVELELKHNNKNEDINQCSQRTQKIFFFFHEEIAQSDLQTDSSSAISQFIN